MVSRRRGGEPPGDRKNNPSESRVRNVVGIAREGSNPYKVSGGSPFGGAFDSQNAYEARRQARKGLDAAKAPSLFGSSSINLGIQGTATVTHSGTEKKGKLNISLNGNPISSVDYGPYSINMKTLEDAFKEAKRRITYYIYA